MAADLMIYWASGVPQCMAALIVLEEKNLQGYKHKLLSFDKKEHKSEEVLKLNPRGEVSKPFVFLFRGLPSPAGFCGVSCCPGQGQQENDLVDS